MKTPPEGIVSELIEIGTRGLAAESIGQSGRHKQLIAAFSSAGNPALIALAGHLEEVGLRQAIRGLILCSRAPGCNWLSASPVVPMYRVYVDRFPTTEPDLTRWIIDNRVSGYDPFNGYEEARSLSEYRAMVAADDKRRATSLAADAERAADGALRRAARATANLPNALQRGDINAVRGLLAQGARLASPFLFDRDPKDDFAALVNSFPLASFVSPRRSTIPLLEYWRSPNVRLAELASLLGLETLDDALLSFEYRVSVKAGRGKPSFTDVMLIGKDVAIAIEAKYTEPEYEHVSEWLGEDHHPDSAVAHQPPSNRQQVLGGWLACIAEATGRTITPGDVADIPYQLIHRLASVCTLSTPRRFLIYQVFTDGNTNVASQALVALHRLVAILPNVDAAVLECPFDTTPSYAALTRLWDFEGIRDLSHRTKDELIEGELLQFRRAIIHR